MKRALWLAPLLAAGFGLAGCSGGGNEKLTQEEMSNIKGKPMPKEVADMLAAQTRKVKEEHTKGP